MKRIQKITKLLSVTFGMVLLVHHVNAQCNSADYTETCISSLDTTYNYIKSFSLDGQNGAAEFVEHSYVFTRDTDYMINWCSNSESESNISLEVLDKNRVSIANSKDQNGSNQLVFTCLATGIYYLKYTFNDSGENCGGSAMGFKPASP
jgi:hypothetical protein